MLGDEPPYLSVGTEVSAKYKGAFCEAKVRKVDKTVKCKVTFKLGNGTHTVLDNSIKGTLRVGASVEAKHPDKKEFVEAIITKIQDCSQYTVVFDDGDITTLRRSALCLKSGRHFAESETLDQLPLTHPEHFGNPVVGGRRGRRRLLDDSSDEEETTRKGKPKEEKEADIGKVVCVELGDKKKLKDNWFPGLVVSPNAQDTVQIRVKDDYLVRSFSDGRYYTVPKKEATEFTREIGLKVDNNTLKTAVEKALTYLDKDELPPHWDRDLLFGLCDSDLNSDSDEGLDSDSSDDEPREEKDHFVAQLYKFMDDRGTPLNNCPTIGGKFLDLYKLFNVVSKLNGYNRVTNRNQWKIVSTKLSLGNTSSTVTQVKHAYKKYLHSFEDFYRKLGCTMVSHPRGNRTKNKSGRSLIRDKDRATPQNSVKIKNENSPNEAMKKEDTSDKEVTTETKIKEEPQVEKKEVEKIKKEETNEKPAKGKNNKKEVEVAAEASDSDDDSVAVSEEAVSVQRPMSSLRKKFPTLKASPVIVREKRKVETSPEARKTKRARLLKSRSGSVEVKGGSDVEEEPKGKDDQRSTTRSRSKEDAKTKKDTEKEKKPKPVPNLENNKKTPSVKAKKQEVEDPSSQKKGRKRRNTETGSRSPNTVDEDLNLPCLPSYKNVFVGDVLKIYYGGPGETKVIYEAKVVDIKEDESGETLYLVHYAGWNSRYDEWVKRNKIADNLNWTPARSKTSPSLKAKAASVPKKKTNKNDQARSTTPSSITSTSSRTKSPAVSTGNKRASRSTGETRPKRTRRISGHTDISMDSDSDSDPGESVSDVEVKKKTKEDLKKEAEPKKEKKTPPKKRVTKKTVKKTDEDDDDEKIKGKRSKKVATPKQKELDEKKSEESKDDEEDDSQDNEEPKGRDFDLNQIRSELKGIDKAVKVNSELVRVDAVDDKNSKAVEEKPEVTEEAATDADIPPPLKEEEKIPVKQEEKIPEKKEVKEVKKADEDIYEFKEPEPFEYQEVLRPMNRIFDDGERSPEKNISKKLPTSAEKKDTMPFEVDVKSRFRKTIGKKMKDAPSPERKDPLIDKMDSPPKKIESYLANSYKVNKLPEKEIPVLKVEMDFRKSISPEPYPVLNCVQEEVLDKKPEIVIEKVDRLKREPEEFPKSPQAAKMSPEPPSLTPITSAVLNDDRPITSPLLTRITEEPKTEIKEPNLEEEEDPINAAIQRVIAQSSMDDDSDDMDLFHASASKDLPPEAPDVKVSDSSSNFNEKKNDAFGSTKKVCPKRKNLGKRTVLSKEFVMDDSSTDSDSDSAEERLVIVNEDESTNDSSQSQKVSAISSGIEEKLSASVVVRRIEEAKTSYTASEITVTKKVPVGEPSPSKRNATVVKTEEEWKCQKQEKTAEEEGENNLRSLLCEETIPGSPAPAVESKEVAEPKLNLLEMQFASGSQPAPPPPRPTAKKDENDAAVVMDNTPPTTPESNLSSISGSPREDRVGSSSLDNESSKSHRDSSEVDVDNDREQRIRSVKFPKKPDKDPEFPVKKKRRSRKRSESLSEMNNKRVRQPVGRPPKHKDPGSDSDDTSENSQIGTHNLNTDGLLSSRSQRPSKYNFYSEIDPELDASQRIALLEQRLQECRKMYMTVKSKLSSIDRRRKKLRKREREEKASAAAAAKNQDLMCQ